MINIIRDLLLTIVNKIDSGNCDMSDDDAIKAIEAIRPFALNNPYVTAYQAYTYLGICRKTFSNLVSEGIIPKGIKVSGNSNLLWLKTDIENYSNKTGKKNKYGITLK